MPNDILLLTENSEAVDLTRVLRACAPELTVTHAATLAELNQACSEPVDGRRLVAFCTPVIVPSQILESQGGPSYNFHPGPPNYPGLFPACHAIMDRATRFGATAHVITKEIDSGAIVGVEEAEISADIDRLHLEALSRHLVVSLFHRLAPLLVNTRTPLPASDVSWSGRVTTRQDFENLCELPADVGEEEFALRYRAVGEGPEHALYINLHGRRFRLDNTAGDGRVYSGGRVLATQED